MLWRSVGFLSVTLQRQNFQVLAGCAPTLEEEVVGRLGRPLSEVPEFWSGSEVVETELGRLEISCSVGTGKGKGNENVVPVCLLARKKAGRPAGLLHHRERALVSSRRLRLPQT